MKKVNIKYNPYKISTLITVDGKTPKVNSALNVAGLRLQEWIENFPGILIDEYRDSNFEIDFTGMEADYNDVVASIKSFGDKINAKCTLHAIPNIDEVEATIDEIFAEILNNKKVPELRSPAIIEAFEKAKNSKFEVNVVATMSSGKSTLINALLGQQLMPTANEATTATIVKIVDTKDSDHFTAVAFDKSGNKVAEVENVTLEQMKKLNKDERVFTVELSGNIPFVRTKGMKLVLVDTPGPNNSRDKRHEEMTYGMISNSKSLVLYVMNGTQLGIKDEQEFLNFICRQMAKGGKQSRERFIFAVNKMDNYRPVAKHDGVGCITRALNEVKKDLEKRGILSPNIFPIASLPALQLREKTKGVEEDDEDFPELEAFKKRSNKYEEMRFENYYNFSNLPQDVRSLMNEVLEWSEKTIAEADEESKEYNEAATNIIEIHSGIVSIEQAVSLYVNKYARTQRVNDLVMAFGGTLEEMATFVTLQKTISNDKQKAKELEEQIKQIKHNINSAREAMTLAKDIDKIDLTTDVQKEITSYLNKVKDQINRMMAGKSRVEKSKAIEMCSDLEKRCRAITAQIKVEIDNILTKAYKTTLIKIIDEYKRHLATLNLGFNAGALAFNPVSLVSASLANLSQIVEENTDTKDEGTYVTKTRRKEGGFFRKAASIFTFGIVDDHTIETYSNWESKFVDYVDMAEVTHDYLEPLQRSLRTMQNNAIDHVKKETVRLKDHLKLELAKIDKVLDSKLEALSNTEADSRAKSLEIAENEAKLSWLQEIQRRVKNIIEF